MHTVRAASCFLPLALLVPVLAQTQPATTTAPRIARTAAPGFSGPGTPFSPDGPVYRQRRIANSSAVAAGLLPPIRPLLDLHIRDTVINLGGDGNYYMTGSTGEVFAHNDGIELWRSPDLQKWEYVGLVCSFAKDATWQKAGQTYQNALRNIIWAPEIWYINKNYFLTYSMPPGNRGILKSTTGKPDGPYVNALADDGKFAGDIDASLFQDDDGKVYLVYGGGWIARMKDDMSGLAEEPKKPDLAEPDKDPAHHAATCAQRRDCLDIGREGAFVFKRNGTYYLTAADTYEGRYSSMVATSDKLFGPYHQRHEAVPTGGGTNYFKDKENSWWCCYFGNDNQSPFKEMPGIVKVDFAADGKIVIASEQPTFVLQPNSPTIWRKAASTVPAR